MSGNKAHWEKVFTTKQASEVSWFQPRLNLSLQMIANAAIPKSEPLIDVGGGDSTLITDLLLSGYTNITVLDISAAALGRAKTRLGAQYRGVKWIEADVTEVVLPGNAFALWHDRAVFHFLTDTESRKAYVDSCRSALKPGGTLIIATFAQDGPEKCSGLPTMRYSPDDLSREFGDSFHLLEAKSEFHTTPTAKMQSFIYCRFIKQVR